MSTKGKAAITQYIVEDIIFEETSNYILVPDYVGSEEDFSEEDAIALREKLKGKKCRMKIEVIEDEELIEEPS